VIALADRGQLAIGFDESGRNRLIFLTLMAVGWGSFLLSPGPARMWLTGEMFAVILLTGLITSVASVGQYASLTLHRPFIDAQLGAADALLGIDVPSVADWARQHPWFVMVLERAYFTLTPQLLLIVPVLRFVKDRAALWEYAFNFYFCLVVTIVIFALWPAAGVYTLYDFVPLVDHSTPPHHIEIYRAGLERSIPWGSIDGLVSMPSFHTAMGCFVTWAVRRHWWLLVPVGITNLLLILATVFLGIHYAVDTVGGIVMFAAGAAVYARFEGWLLRELFVRETAPTTLSARQRSPQLS
jgi:membrane-associated phospholipid phosphatase